MEQIKNLMVPKPVTPEDVGKEITVEGYFRNVWQKFKVKVIMLVTVEGSNDRLVLWEYPHYDWEHQIIQDAQAEAVREFVGYQRWKEKHEDYNDQL